MQRITSSVALLSMLQTIGCAAVLGLDTGKDVIDAGADATDEAGSAQDAATPVDSGGPSCSPNTGDCNSNPNDGCETKLDTPQHCGSCTKTCQPFEMCMGGACCVGQNGDCNGNGQCCSNKCDGNKCSNKP